MQQGNLPLYWEHATGISGFLALFMLLFIAAPMSFQRLRRAISYEYRKAMHYLAFPFTLALVYHLDWADGFLPQVSGFLPQTHPTSGSLQPQPKEFCIA